MLAIEFFKAIPKHFSAGYRKSPFKVSSVEFLHLTTLMPIATVDSEKVENLWRRSFSGSMDLDSTRINGNWPNSSAAYRQDQGPYKEWAHRPYFRLLFRSSPLCISACSLITTFC